MIVYIWKVKSDDNKKLDELTKYLENIPKCMELEGDADFNIVNIYCVDAKINFINIAKKIYNDFIIDEEYIFEVDDHKYNNNYLLSINYLSLSIPYRLIKQLD
jgi:hypothetical protein